MLIMIIAASAAFIITIIAMGIYSKGIDINVVLSGFLIAIMAAAVGLITAGILSFIPSNTIEAGINTYALVENVVDDSSYYVTENIPNDTVRYHFCYIDENGNTQTVDVDGDYVAITDSAKQPSVTCITKTIPDGWKQWCFWRDIQIYKISVPSMQSVRCE